MPPKLHTNKCIKDRVQAAVGESNEPAHIECIVELDTCFAVMKWWNQMVIQDLQKDDNIVRHPADEEHSHDTED